jgi:hypothetical protein
MPKLYQSVVINAPIDKVWAVIRDFNSLATWHQFIETSRIVDDLPGTCVGGTRVLLPTAKAKEPESPARYQHEKLLLYSERDHYYFYQILQTPLAVTDYSLTLGLLPITENNTTLAYWSGEFAVAKKDLPPPMNSDEFWTMAISERVLLGGLKSLQEAFATGEFKELPKIYPPPDSAG